MMKLREMTVAWIGLFTSLTTLLCCALPVLFVFLGLGTVLAGISIHASWITSLSQYKFWLFLVSGIFLAIGSVMVRFPVKDCPVDAKEKCMSLRKVNQRVLLVSKYIWFLGFIMAYLALPLHLWMTR